MTITYPLTIPTTQEAAQIEMIQNTVCAVSQSPFTGQQQVVEYDGGLWGATVSYPPMKKAIAAPLIAFLFSLRGTRGTFYLGPKKFGTLQGAGGGTPLVYGASQVGYTLVTDGWPNSETVLEAGDFFQIGDSLYMVLSRTTSNGSGKATIDIWPNARNHADNAPLIFTNPKCIMRLTPDSATGFEEIPDDYYSVAFSCQEAR